MLIKYLGKTPVHSVRHCNFILAEIRDSSTRNANCIYIDINPRAYFIYTNIWHSHADNTSIAVPVSLRRTF